MDIFIYIEIPNCFKDYLSKFSILSIFEKENITFKNMPPSNFPNDINKHFENMLGINSMNNGIQEFVNKQIGKGDLNAKYSYHQINIFVKLFLSQYSKYKTKIKFLDENQKDVTESCIEDFAKSTQYFTNGGFAKLLTGEINTGKKYVINILSKVYENDLKKMKFENPLIFTYEVNKKLYYHKLYFPKKDSKQYQSSKDFLNKIIWALNLPYKVEDLLDIIEKDNNYVITNDNFKKMALLLYRIIANVPVIIMGDTGCGKTSLINVLNQILNGGKTTFEYTDIKSGEKKRS